MLPQMQLPDAVSGLFTFLLYDSPRYTNWHRGKKERSWTEQLAGGGVVDLDELAAACPPPGCLVRTAWAGAGHVGLCAVDRQNNMAGSRQQRALFRYRHRIFSRWDVPHTPIWASGEAAAAAAHAIPPSAEGGGLFGGGQKLPIVLVVQTKRVVTNLPAFVASINKGRFADARLIKWEGMSFAEQLRVMRSAAVQVSGVGSAQINQFLLPRGSVAVCLGWRDEHARHRIHYFDHHILRSLDHARVLYYPSYTAAELRQPSAVTLDLPKATALIKQAVDIYKQGFTVPIDPDVQANKYDRAFTKLNEQTNDLALAMRTTDYDWAGSAVPQHCHTFNGVEGLFWGASKMVRPAQMQQCPWYRPVPALLSEFDL